MIKIKGFREPHLELREKKERKRRRRGLVGEAELQGLRSGEKRKKQNKKRIFFAASSFTRGRKRVVS